MVMNIFSRTLTAMTPFVMFVMRGPLVKPLKPHGNGKKCHRYVVLNKKTACYRRFFEYT